MAERTFFVKTIKLENEAAIGVTERVNDTTVYIASIYLPGHYSRTALFNAWNRHVSELLQPDDKALIFTNDITVHSKRRLKWPNHNFVLMRNPNVLWEAGALCKDALLRKTTITEVLNE